MVIVIVPTKHPSKPEIDGVRREKTRTLIIIKGVGDGHKSRVTFLTSMKNDMMHSTAHMQKMVVARLSMSWHCQEHHQNVTPLHEIDEFVGVGLGKSFSFWCEAEKSSGKKDIARRVNDILKKNKGLREFSSAFPWFGPMMVAVLRNKLVPPKGLSAVGMHEISPKDGKDIGGSLGLSIMACQMSYAAVDDWVFKSKAVQELDKTFVWFRPMMNTIAFQVSPHLRRLYIYMYGSTPAHSPTHEASRGRQLGHEVPCLRGGRHFGVRLAVGRLHAVHLRVRGKRAGASAKKSEGAPENDCPAAEAGCIKGGGGALREKRARAKRARRRSVLLRRKRAAERASEASAKKVSFCGGSRRAERRSVFRRRKRASERARRRYHAAAEAGC
jgi:hypothetical protein